MKYTFPHGEIAPLVAIAVKAVEGRKISNIAECIRIRFNQGGICFDSTNYDQWIEASSGGFDASAADIQTAIVPGKQFASMIATMAKGSDIGISISAAKNKLTLEVGESKYTFGLQAADSWPALNWAESKWVMSFGGREFGDRLSFALQSAATDDTRAYLKGVFFGTVQKNRLRICGCDGHRGSFSIFAPPIEEGCLPENGVILPRKMASLLIELIDDGYAGDITIQFTQGRCRFIMGGDRNIVVIGKLIDGQYPDVDRIVPYQRDGHVNSMPRQATIEALRRLDIMTNEKKRHVIIRFKDGRMSLSTSGEQTTADEVMEVSKQGGDARLCFNSGLLLSLLSAFRYDDISILSHKDGGSEAAILVEKVESVTKETPEFSVLMPMRL